MPTKKASSKQSKASRKAWGSRKLSPLARNIIEGLGEAAAHFRGEKRLRTTTYLIPGEIDIKSLRQKLGLSQVQFALRYCFNPRTLQDWEQGRVKPDSAVRAYLNVIAKEPEAVKRALSS